MIDRTADLERTLRIIRTWAVFFADYPDDQARVLREIAAKCDEVLGKEEEVTK